MKWQNGLRQLHENVKQLISKLLRGHKIPVSIPEDTPDDMANNTWGYSWIHNGQFTEEHGLLRALMNDTEMNLCTVTQHGELVWNVAAMLEWMEVAKELNISLCIETHCVPGQVSRASELCDGRIINGLRGRNLFRIHGSTWWINRRVKSEHLLHHESFIPIKFPPEMEEVLHTYLLVIRPVEIEFARQLWGQECAALYNEYMWVTMDQRLMENRFSQQLEAFSREHFECELSVRPYRQIVVALSRTYLGSEADIDEEDSDALVEQRGHSVDMCRTHYGRRVDRLHSLTDDVLVRFGRVSEAWWQLVGFYPGRPPLLPLEQRRNQKLHPTSQGMEQQDPKDIHQVAGAFNSQELMAMMDTMIRGAFTQFAAEMKKEIRTAVASGMASFLDRQVSADQQPKLGRPGSDIPPQLAVQPSTNAFNTMLSPLAANDVLLPSPVEPSKTTTKPFNSLQSPPAAQGERFPLDRIPSPTLSLLSVQSPPTTPEYHFHPFDNDSEEEEEEDDDDDDDGLSYVGDPEPSQPSQPSQPSEQPPSVVQKKNSLGLLREVLSNPDACFKSAAQKRIIDKALECDENFIAVLRTGGGKSMSFLIPAYADQLSGHGMTIVIIPNKVLLADILQQSSRYGVKCAVWLASKPVIASTNLVLMAIETAASPKFQE